MTFGNLLSKYPDTGEVLLKHGLRCFGCSMSFAETIEQGAVMHGVEVKELLKELNEFVEKEKKK